MDKCQTKLGEWDVEFEVTKQWVNVITKYSETKEHPMIFDSDYRGHPASFFVSVDSLEESADEDGMPALNCAGNNESWEKKNLLDFWNIKVELDESCGLWIHISNNDRAKVRISEQVGGAYFRVDTHL